MATLKTNAPTLPHPATVQLVTLNDVGWNTKLLVPASLLSKFAELMGMCSVVETEWIAGSCETIAIKGDVEFATQTVGQKHVICNSKEQAVEFKKFHDATYELTPAEDRTPNRPVVTMDDFMKSLSDQAATHTPSFTRS